MKDLNEWFLYSIKLNSDRILCIDKGKEYTYKHFYIDASKIYSYINKGKVLIKCESKYFFIISFTACLFKQCMPFLSNKDSHIYDDYEFDLVIDDEFVLKTLENDKYELYQYEEFDNNIPAMVILSSGTTNTPKPVVLSHKAIVTNLLSARKIFRFGDNWTFVSIIPLDHTFGIRADFIEPFVKGVRIIYSYSLIEYFSNIRKYNPDKLTLSVSLLKNLHELFLHEGKDKICPSLKCLSVGGSKCSIDMIKYFKDKYDIVIMNGYGLTECSPYVSITSFTHYKEGSEGYILDCHKVKIGKDNEIIISGDSIMLNYLDLYEKGIIAKEIHTKDCGYVLDNYLFITGRIDNLIILDNGYKIQPETFEEDIIKKYKVDDCILYYKNNILYLDVVTSNKIANIISKDYESLYLQVNIVDNIIRNKLGKINRSYYINN